MRLYHHPVSIDCRKVRVVAAELGVDLELVSVSDTHTPGAASTHREPPSRAQPLPEVPSLVDGEAVVSVPNTILQYMADRHPHVLLWPECTTTRAYIARWQLWEATDFGPAVRSLVESRLARATHDAPSAQDSQAMAWFHCFAAMLDHHLRSHPYVMGDQPTLADFSVVAPLSLAEQADLPLSPYAHIVQWRQRLESRPSMRSIPLVPPAGRFTG